MASNPIEYFCPNGPDSARVAIAKGWLKANAVVEDSFSDMSIFANPAWNIMLDLFIACHLNRQVCITSACIASRGPQSTAMRYIAALIDAGFLTRTSDAEDRRKSYVSLTRQGYDRVVRAIDKAAESHRKLGLSPVRLVEEVKRTL